MSKYNGTPIPYGYCVCQHADCPKAPTCLRQLAYTPEMEDESSIFVHLLKPSLGTKKADCPYYRDSTPVRFAKGFKNMQKQMLPGQYERFRLRLIGHFGRNPYYERRRGNRLLTPEEQAVIRQVLKEVAIIRELKFDSYVEKLYW